MNAQPTTVGTKPAARRRRSGLFSDPLMGYLFTLPVIVSLSVFLIGPIIYAFFLSFQSFTFLDPEGAQFVGLDNYLKLFEDERFHRALFNTSIYSLGVIPVQVSIALVLALIVNSKIKGKTFFRVAYFLPTVTSTVAVPVMFLFLFKKGGLLNHFLGWFGIPARSWFDDVTFALPSIMVMAVWSTVGQFMVIYLAGLQDIPDDLYEAAQIDGAGPWRTYIKVVLPTIAPIFLAVIVVLLQFAIKTFDLVVALTAGGPGLATTFPALYVYDMMFQRGQIAQGAAAAIMILAALAVVLVPYAIYLVWRRRREMRNV